MQDTLHEFIVRRECRNNGWQLGNWKVAFANAAKANELFEGEFVATEDNGKEIWGGVSILKPDAWRIVVEGPETESVEWGCPVLVLEFLEVEISHPMPLKKRRNYIHLWWSFDSTSCFHLRVHHIGRYGPSSVWLDFETALDDISILE